MFKTPSFARIRKNSEASYNLLNLNSQFALLLKHAYAFSVVSEFEFLNLSTFWRSLYCPWLVGFLISKNSTESFVFY